MPRLFVSVDLDGLAAGVAAVQDRLPDASGLRRTDPDQAHVTLKFLGDVSGERVPEVTDAVETAVADSGVEPFEATFGGLGVFPSPEYISVVWLGVDAGAEPLTRLHEAVEERTVALGFDPADHEFTPHVTLARLDNAGGKEAVQSVVREADPTAGSRRVEAVRLTESTLIDEGPVYETVAAVTLD